MIPLQIQLKGFMSYRTPVTVDFRAVRTACLSGENGAGKSALLEAMTWAVWGKSRASSSRDIVTLGESQVEVTFDFQLGDREYRVFRRQSSGGRSSPALEFFVRPAGDEEGDWHTITGDSVRETDRKIVAMLKMDYDTFVNSAFLMQGQADTFTQKRPGERKKVLADILNLGDYDALSSMAREEERALRGRANNLNSQIDRLEERLESRAEVEAELESLSSRSIEASKTVEAVEEETRNLQETLSALNVLLRSRKATSERLKRQQERFGEFANQVSADRKATESLSALIDRGEEIERDYRDLVKWRGVNDAQSVLLGQRQPLERRLSEIERDIDRARSRQEREIDRITSEVGQIEAELADIARSEVERTTLDREVASAGDLDSRFQLLTGELRATESEQATLEAECRALRASMEEIKVNLELLESGDAECPICRRPMGEGEHKHVASIWKTEGKQLGDAFRANRKRIKELETLLPDKRRVLAELEAARTVVAEKQAVARRLAAESGRKAELEADMASRHRERTMLQEALSKQTYAGELPATAAGLVKQLDALPFDAELAGEATRNLARLARAEQMHIELQTARVRHANLLETIATREIAIAEVEADIAALQQELDEVSSKLGDEPETRRRLSDSIDALEKARSERDKIQARFGAVNNQLDELDRLARELDQYRKEIDVIGTDAEAYRELALAFGRNGIQAMIVETILPELEDEANRLLAKMTTNHLHVRFRSTRQAISNDNIIETLDIVIRDETGERPYALYSGGEAFRVDFAIRVALSKLLVRRAGTTIDMLIIDEGFGTQDARGRDGLIDALQTVESDFATILVITHIDEVRDMFPTRIEVAKTETGSTVNVV